MNRDQLIYEIEHLFSQLAILNEKIECLTEEISFWRAKWFSSLKFPKKFSKKTLQMMQESLLARSRFKHQDLKGAAKQLMDQFDPDSSSMKKPMEIFRKLKETPAVKRLMGNLAAR